MADSNANSAVSTVAIIAIVVLIGLVVYLLFLRGPGSEATGGGEDGGARIELDVNEDGGSVEIEGDGAMAPAAPGFLSFVPVPSALPGHRPATG